MNLFLLHHDPEINAWLHHDKHVVKMILEITQVASTIASERNHYAPYKPTHRNHPIVQWARSNDDNLCYLINIGFYLSMEYTKRYGKVHKSSFELEKIAHDMIGHITTYTEPTSYVQCFPDQYKNDDPFQGYRDYYVAEKLYQSNGKQQTWRKNSEIKAITKN